MTKEIKDGGLSYKDLLDIIVASTKSHIDGRDLLDELHPRRMLDIKRRVDGVDTWFEGDWLSTLRMAIKLYTNPDKVAPGKRDNLLSMLKAREKTDD